MIQTSPNRRLPRPATWREPIWFVAAMLLLGVAIAPFVYHYNDVVGFFLIWARGTRGAEPWGAYGPDNCDYPPLVPYLVTLVEGARLRLGASPEGPVAILLIKLPNLLAYAAGVPLCRLGLRRVWGDDGARKAAWLWALCLPLWINGAVWGQFDTVLAVAMALAVIGLLRDRPALAGAALGLSVATKVAAIMVVPVLGIYLWRRFGAGGFARATGAAVAVLALLALPHFLGGSGDGVVKAYTASVDFVPQRSVSAYNGWYLLDGFDAFVRDLPPSIARADTRGILRGPITYKQVGIALLALHLLWLSTLVWRNPERRVLIYAATMSVFGFFMLPTQMHDRYLIPGVAFLALLGDRLTPRAGRLFWGLVATASLNQLIAHVRVGMSSWTPLPPGSWGDRITLGLAAVVALVNIGLFVWALIAVRAEMVPENATGVGYAPKVQRELTM